MREAFRSAFWHEKSIEPAQAIDANGGLARWAACFIGSIASVQ
jgi:hypothetical protein